VKCPAARAVQIELRPLRSALRRSPLRPSRFGGLHRPRIDDLHHRRRKPESPFSLDAIDRNLRRQPDGSSGSSAGNAKCTIADGEDTANPVANLRSAIERVTISKTTISIELTDAVAAESRDRTLILHWTPPSPTRRREIDEWVKTFGCHWKTSDWTYKTTDNTDFFIGKKAAAFSDLKTGETVRVTYHVVDKVWIADT
jgi:hypothetical protein